MYSACTQILVHTYVWEVLLCKFSFHPILMLFRSLKNCLPSVGAEDSMLQTLLHLCDQYLKTYPPFQLFRKRRKK